jgi:hypothetical protein
MSAELTAALALAATHLDADETLAEWVQTTREYLVEADADDYEEPERSALLAVIRATDAEIQAATR